MDSCINAAVLLSEEIRCVNLILEVRTMKEFTAEDAYYYYMLILTGYRKELETLVIDELLIRAIKNDEIVFK